MTDAESYITASDAMGFSQEVAEPASLFHNNGLHYRSYMRDGFSSRDPAPTSLPPPALGRDDEVVQEGGQSVNCTPAPSYHMTSLLHKGRDLSSNKDGTKEHKRSRRKSSSLSPSTCSLIPAEGINFTSLHLASLASNFA